MILKVRLIVAFQSYEYFVLNGEWTIWAKDLVESMQDNYNLKELVDSNFTIQLMNIPMDIIIHNKLRYPIL